MKWRIAVTRGGLSMDLARDGAVLKKGRVAPFEGDEVAAVAEARRRFSLAKSHWDIEVRRLDPPSNGKRHARIKKPKTLSDAAEQSADRIEEAAQDLLRQGWRLKKLAKMLRTTNT